MIPLPGGQTLDREQRRLLESFGRLGTAGRESLLAFAEFLVTREQASPPAEGPREPMDVPRPRDESVVAAIRRLSLTYPMLERRDMLNETAALMSAHVVQGRPAVEVVEELEVVFRTHYERYRAHFER